MQWKNGIKRATLRNGRWTGARRPGRTSDHDPSPGGGGRGSQEIKKIATKEVALSRPIRHKHVGEGLNRLDVTTQEDVGQSRSGGEELVPTLHALPTTPYKTATHGKSTAAQLLGLQFLFLCAHAPLVPDDWKMWRLARARVHPREAPLRFARPG